MLPVQPEHSEQPSVALFDAHRTERLGPYLADLWGRRRYVAYVAASDLRARQVNTVLGNVWHLLNPALSIAVYYVVFGLLLKVDRGIDNFILFLTVGVFVFQYTQRSTMQGANSIVTNLGLIRGFRFPRLILPLTAVVTESLAAAPTMLVMFGVALLTGGEPRWQWALVPAVLSLQFAFNFGAATIAARATSHFRDLTQILPFLFRMLLYGSGVIFSVTAYASGAHALWFELNPMYCFITLYRWCVMGEDAHVGLLVSAASWSLLLVLLSVAWFRSGEDQYGRE